MIDDRLTAKRVEAVTARYQIAYEAAGRNAERAVCDIIEGLEAERDALATENRKLKIRIDIQDRALERYSPCMDCHDKVQRGECQRCARQRAEAKVERLADRVAELEERVEGFIALGKRLGERLQRDMRDPQNLLRHAQEYASYLHLAYQAEWQEAWTAARALLPLLGAPEAGGGGEGRDG